MRFYCRRCKTSYQHREVRGAKEPGPRRAACVGDRDLGSRGRLGGQAWGPRAQGCVRRRPPRGGMLKAGFSVARSLRAGPATPSASPSRPCPRPPLSARPPGGTRPSLSRPSPEAGEAAFPCLRPLTCERLWGGTTRGRLGKLGCQDRSRARHSQPAKPFRAGALPPSCGARRCFPPWAPALSRVGPHGP